MAKRLNVLYPLHPLLNGKSYWHGHMRLWGLQKHCRCSVHALHEENLLSPLAQGVTHSTNHPVSLHWQDFLLSGSSWGHWLKSFKKAGKVHIFIAFISAGSFLFLTKTSSLCLILAWSVWYNFCLYLHIWQAVLGHINHLYTNLSVFAKPYKSNFF